MSTPRFLNDVSEMAASSDIGKGALLRLISPHNEESTLCDIQAIKDDDGNVLILMHNCF